jgi:hypothetical protein
MIRRWSTIDIRWRIAPIALLAAIILPVAWYLGSPLFINVAVNERFPDAVPLAATTNAPTAQHCYCRARSNSGVGHEQRA